MSTRLFPNLMYVAQIILTVALLLMSGLLAYQTHHHSSPYRYLYSIDSKSITIPSTAWLSLDELDVSLKSILSSEDFILEAHSVTVTILIGRASETTGGLKNVTLCDARNYHYDDIDTLVADDVMSDLRGRPLATCRNYRPQR